jgi:diguanylate cyclase (GGDEF)-like protein/PAS domain S-box-containing protein
MTLGTIALKLYKDESSINSLVIEKKNTEITIEALQKQFQIIFSHTDMGIALLNLDGAFVKINQALCELLGFDEKDMLDKNYHYLIHPIDNNKLQILNQKLIDNKIKFYKTEQQVFRKNGEVLWIMVIVSLVRDRMEKPAYFILQVQNISLQKKAEERLNHMAYHDPLTGLANRNKLEQFINQLLAEARRYQRGFALLFLDLDRFKNINDTIGHESGDLLLQVIAERLRSTIRSTDMVARLGGDEFVLVITDIKKVGDVALISQKILENILNVVMIKEQEIYITTSIGISLYPYDGEDLQVLMKNADLALYRAKEHGRNNYQFYTEEMTCKALNKLALQSALGHALAKDEFTLHYQPKMDLLTRHITGVESLLRWKNKEHGMIMPQEIIELAEETGLIIPVSEWILKTSCQQLRKWHDQGFITLTVAINCTTKQFKRAAFVDEILQMITALTLPPHTLEIELKETTIMEDPDNTLRVLYALKDIGVQIAIDDFGTGYWSLNHLKKLHIDKIKIDKSFIKQITTDNTSAAITKAIIAMVNKLNIKSVAEGVETREQYEFLVQEGCTEIQGFYLTRPLEASAMTEFLKHPIPNAEVISNLELDKIR